MGDALRTAPPGFDDLSAEEQINYVQFLWDRIAAQPDRIPVPEWHNDVLSERLAELESDPDAGRPWEDVRADLRASLAKKR